MVQPSGPIAIICGINDAGEIIPIGVNATRELLTAGGSTSVDASAVTYTPSTAADWNGGVDPGNQDDANDQLAERVKALEGLSVDELLPCRAEWFHYKNFVVTGNALAIGLDPNQIFNANVYQSPGANGDVFTNSVVLKPGAYTLNILGIKSSGNGKIDIDFKHVNDAGYTSIVAGQDWYVGGTTYNAVITATFTIVTAGRHIFKFTVNGKHASSSGYTIPLTKFDIYLTAGDS